MMSTRPFTAKDAAKLSQMINQVCADTPWMSTREFIPTDPWIHALQNDQCHFHYLLVAESNGEMVGWCRSFPAVCQMSSSDAELGIGLLKEYRNQGIGSEMIVRTLEWANTIGLRKINLTVSPKNSIAVHVFENCGFKPVNVQDDTVLMSVFLTKKLSFPS